MCPRWPVLTYMSHILTHGFIRWTANRNKTPSLQPITVKTVTTDGVSVRLCVVFTVSQLSLRLLYITHSAGAAELLLSSSFLVTLLIVLSPEPGATLITIV